MKNKEKKGKLFSFKFFMQDFIRITGALPLLIWLRPKRLYASEEAKKKIKGGAIIASNHIGYSDVMCLMSGVWYRRHHIVGTKELFKGGFKNFLFSKAFLCLPIDKEKPDIVNVRSIISHLKDGELVDIFPEGHIESGDENLANFKSGMSLMAVMSGKPIVPVYLHKRKNVFKRMVIAIGEPIYVDEEERKKSPLEYINKLSEQVYESTKNLQKICTERKK